MVVVVVVVAVTLLLWLSGLGRAKDRTGKQAAVATSRSNQICESRELLKLLLLLKGTTRRRRRCGPFWLF